MSNVYAQPKARKPRRNRKYIAWVATHPCIYCGAESGPPHHARWAGPCGMGQKPSDTYIIPVCTRCHDAIHSASGARYRDMIRKIGNEEILSAMLDQADEWMQINGI